jgi:hypothetical protein
MNNPDVTLPMGDDLYDLIVDGKLTAAELRAALERLDNEPDGWKRCTLAFLEAQCWRQTFLQLGEMPAAGNAPSQSLTAPFSAGRRTRSHWARRAIAAAIAVGAFGLGWVAPRTGAVRGPQPRAHVATVATALEARSTDSAPAAMPVAAEPEPVAPAPPVRLVGRLRLGEADVPILAGPGIDAEWLKNQPRSLSEYRKAVLQQRGYRIDERRDMIPATLADGRRVAVPVDSVQIRYTGNDPL